ncbi:MAG: helix-turn-helix transcriptional regulator [Bacteroidetes bacterium]|nr:helix-turn-helix transcriptional regulator [Bacteroidota bacterium]
MKTNEIEINKRIEVLIQNLGLNINSFSKKIGIQNNVTIGNIIKGRQSPGYTTIMMILKTFPNLNTDWLIKGEGNMFNDNATEESVSMVHEKEIQYKTESLSITLAGNYLDVLMQKITSIDEKLSIISKNTNK